MRFRALTDFWCEELRSQYGRTLLYTARTDRLKALVAQWVVERKVELVAEGTDAIISGHGRHGTQRKSLWARIKGATGWR